MSNIYPTGLREARTNMMGISDAFMGPIRGHDVAWIIKNSKGDHSHGFLRGFLGVLDIYGENLIKTNEFLVIHALLTCRNG